MRQLSGLDSVFVLGEIPTVPLHVSALFVYDVANAEPGQFTYESLLSRLQGLIQDDLQVLRAKVDSLPFSIDEPYWVEDPNFNLPFHVQRVGLPSPADWNELYALCGRLHSEPLNRERPLWQAWLIEGLDKLDGVPAGAMGVFIKVHHALMDGKSAIRLFTGLHSHQAQPEPGFEWRLKRHNPGIAAPGPGRKLWRAYKHNVMKPLRLAGMAGQALPAILSKKEKPTVKDVAAKTPKTVLNGRISANRVVGHVPLPFDRIREIAHKHKVTINDVALSLVGGALRRYLMARHDLPLHSMVAGMPMDVRSSEDQETLGNVVSVASVVLGTDIEDPMQRLWAIHDSSHKVKKKTASSGPKAVKSLVDSIYPAVIIPMARWLVDSGLIYKMPATVNAVVSNVPGSREPCYLNGAKLVDYLGFGPLAPTMGLFHVVSSTDKLLSLSFTSCPQIMPEPDAYRQALLASWQALDEAAG